MLSPVIRTAAFIGLALAVAACASRRPAAGPKPLPAPGAKARVDAPRRRADLARQETDLSRQFYLAVGSYMQGDYVEARGILNGILRLDPANPDALALRRRIRAAERLNAADAALKKVE